MSRKPLLISCAALAAALLAIGCAARGSSAGGAEGGAAGNYVVSPMAVLRSTDRGATWTALGHVRVLDMEPDMLTVDPTPLVVDGRIVLYFIDMRELTGDADVTSQRALYRATSLDGVNFDTPQPAFALKRDMVDPFVLRLADGSFIAYVMSGAPGGRICVTGSDSLAFGGEAPIGWSGEGGMPGALLLPDGRVRLFHDGGPNAVGIKSMISSDGVHFTEESGERIAKPAGYLGINNPEPIRLADGSYLMLWQTQDPVHAGRPEWCAEIHLATSADGFDWTADSRVLEYGGTSCVVEAPDGTLFIYYGTK